METSLNIEKNINSEVNNRQVNLLSYELPKTMLKIKFYLNP